MNTPPTSAPAVWTALGTDVPQRELRQDRAIRTRAEIMDAAADLFASQGFQTTSLQQVAKHAEVTKGAVYHHFPTKEILAVAVIEEHYSRWPVLLQRLQARNLSPWDTAMEMLDQAAVSFRDDTAVRGGARLQLERRQINAAIPEPYVGWIQLLTELLEQARRRGQLQPGIDPAEAARCLVSGFFGMQHISDVLHSRLDITDRWAELRAVFTKAMRA
jgi:AcrR family transcriptional regulator